MIFKIYFDKKECISLDFYFIYFLDKIAMVFYLSRLKQIQIHINIVYQIICKENYLVSETIYKIITKYQ